MDGSNRNLAMAIVELADHLGEEYAPDEDLHRTYQRACSAARAVGLNEEVVDELLPLEIYHRLDDATVEHRRLLDLADATDEERSDACELHKTNARAAARLAWSRDDSPLAHERYRQAVRLCAELGVTVWPNII